MLSVLFFVMKGIIGADWPALDNYSGSVKNNNINAIASFMFDKGSFI